MSDDPLERLMARKAAAQAGATDPLARLKARQPVPTIASETTAVRPNYIGDKQERAAAPAQFGTGFLRAGEQGATLSFGDEINAGVRALGKETYQGALKDERDKLSAYKKENPGTALAAELGGSLLGGGAVGAGAKALGMGARVASSGLAMTKLQKAIALAKQGGIAAAAGGATAAGGSEGTLAERVGAIPSGAGFGLAAVLGLKAAGGISRGLGVTALAKSVIPRAANGRSLAGRLSNIADVSTTSDLAHGDVLKLAQRARMSLPELEAKAAGAHPDEMLLDLVGQPAVERAGGAVATPSRGGADIVKRLDERAQRAPKGVRDEASRALGVTRENTVQTIEEQAAKRSAQDDEAFGALRQHYGTPQKIDALDGLVGRPSFDKAIGETENILRESPGGLSQPLLTKVKVNGKTQTVVRPLTFDEATLLKQSHDDVAGMGTALSTIETGGVTKTRAGKQKNTHGELMDALKASFSGDEATGVPSYEKALSQSAEPMKLIKAHGLGQDFMKAKTDELQAMWPNLSEPEREFYRKGAIASIEDAVRGKTDGFNPVRDFRDDIMRDNIGTITKTPEDKAAFYDAVERFQGMHSNRGQIVGNSKTASRMAQMAESAGPAQGVETAAQVLTGNTSGVLSSLARTGLGRRMSGLSEAQVDALAPLLTASGSELQSVIRELQRVAARQGRQGAKTAGTVGQLAGSNAASAGPRRP